MVEEVWEVEICEECEWSLMHGCVCNEMLIQGKVEDFEEE